MNWKELKFWDSGEWQVIKEKLNDLKKKGITYNPERKDLFRALKETPFAETRVVIMGQDPYPNHNHATGIGFDVPIGTSPLPVTLQNIFKEYQDDLYLPEPISGCLVPWCRAGVLLWNAYPSCTAGRPGSHHWDEWTYLTKEIMERLDENGNVVFCLLGTQAAKYSMYINRSPVIITSHPSALGVKYGFKGSRIFREINRSLLTPIDWRLP
jgi:uracil-DNA glycosylase